MRCRYSNCFPVVGHVIAFTLFCNTSIPFINALISTSPVLSSMIALRRNGGIFSFVRGSSNWSLSYFICFLCTCWIIFRVGYICVARPSGRLYVLSLSTFEFSGRLSLFPFSFILSLSCCFVSSLSSSIIFGPTLCPPGMFGGVTL